MQRTPERRRKVKKDSDTRLDEDDKESQSSGDDTGTEAVGATAPPALIAIPAELLQSLTTMCSQAMMAMNVSRVPAVSETCPQPRREPRPVIAVPEFTGYHDHRTVVNYIGELELYQNVTGASDEHMLKSIVPLALKSSAKLWFDNSQPYTSLGAFKNALRAEFLPPLYKTRVQRDLHLRTQGPQESLVEYIRVMQELYRRAEPEASESAKIERILQQCHPLYHVYLFGRSYNTVDELVRHAHLIQDTLYAGMTYMLPPAPDSMVEPSLGYDPGARYRAERRGQVAYLSSPRALEPPHTSVEAWHGRPHLGAGRNDTQFPRDTRNFQSPGLGAPVVMDRDSRRTGPDDGRQSRDTRNPTRAPSRARREIPSDGAAPMQDDARGVVAKDATGPVRCNYGNSGRCYNCGRWGHYARDCPQRNQPSPKPKITFPGNGSSRRR